MKDIRRTLAFLLCLALVLSACTKADSQEGTAPEKPAASEQKERQSNLDMLQPAAYGNTAGLNLEPGSYISLIGRSGTGEFWEMINQGAGQAIDDLNKALGYTGEDKIKLTYSGPSTKDNVDEQVNILDEELDRYPVAVGISIVDSGACQVQFDLAAENNIPIIAFESGSEYEGIEAMISTDNTEAIQTAATKLSQLVDKSGEVLLFVHDTNSAAAKERKASFIEKIEKDYPDMKVAGIYYMDQLEDFKQDIAKQQLPEEEAQGDAEPDTEGKPEEPLNTDSITPEQVMSYILEQHPQAKGCLATDSDTTQEVLKAVKSVERTDFQIIGFEGGTKQLEALANEEIAGLIIQNPFGMGYASVVAAARAALGVGNEAVIDCGYIWVTKENMDTESIRKVLY